MNKILYVLFIACALNASDAMKGKNVYVYDPVGIFEEAIVSREVDGLKYYLESHTTDPDMKNTMNIKDKYNRSCIHYAALIEDEELYKLMLGLGADVSVVDCFGFSAEDYLKGKHK